MAILLNVRLPAKLGLYCLEVVGHQLRSILPMAKVAANAVQAIDLGGDWVSLGGVDLQINGALGLAFPDLDQPEELEKAAVFLWNQGVDAFAPTIVTTDVVNFHRSLAVIRAYQSMGPQPGQAKVLGAHLEGPFLNPAKRGAHPEEYIQPLSLERVQSLLADYVDVVKIVTLAPEMETDAKEVVSWLRSHNIIVSLGHSLATAPQAQSAFAQGASMVTHAFNAMPGLHHREPGLLGAALTQSGVFAGVIADGQHVCPTMLDLLLRAARGTTHQEGGLFLVSDALSPLGLPDGTYPWDSREINVQNGTARLAGGTLSGTTLPLLDGVKNLVRWGICSVDEAILMATARPRQALGLPTLAPRQCAHLLRWHYDGQNLSWQRILEDGSSA